RQVCARTFLCSVTGISPPLDSTEHSWPCSGEERAFGSNLKIRLSESLKPEQ
ncbi:hypothetical protein CHS0354_007988, partial [Potamilus streckersoni]